MFIIFFVYIWLCNLCCYYSLLLLHKSVLLLQACLTNRTRKQNVSAVIMSMTRPCGREKEPGNLDSIPCTSSICRHGRRLGYGAGLVGCVKCLDRTFVDMKFVHIYIYEIFEFILPAFHCVIDWSIVFKWFPAMNPGKTSKGISTDSTPYNWHPTYADMSDG